MIERVALLGASGFVGSAVHDALERTAAAVTVIPAPRLSTSLRSPSDLIEAARQHPAVRSIRAQVAGAQTLVNAAGYSDASSLDEDRLFGANVLLPLIALEAAAAAGVTRFVHVSSAVVQNDKAVLDESEDLRPFSPYSMSKAVAEQALRSFAPAPVSVVRYRPPSVHAPGRRVTRMVARIASSPVATVARPGDQPTPQALLPNVGSAIAYLATVDTTPPPIVIHPSEGVTTASLMRDLGRGRDPRTLPRWFARTAVSVAKLVGRAHRPTAANARRLELLWLGQRQGESWLTTDGWRPAVGAEGWRSLMADEPGVRT